MEESLMVDPKGCGCNEKYVPKTRINIVLEVPTATENIVEKLLELISTIKNQGDFSFQSFSTNQW